VGQQPSIRVNRLRCKACQQDFLLLGSVATVRLSSLESWLRSRVLNTLFSFLGGLGEFPSVQYVCGMEVQRGRGFCDF
jgi:hypothetical protein